MIQTIPTDQVTVTATTLGTGEQFHVEPMSGSADFGFDGMQAIEGDLGTVLDAIDDAAGQQAEQLARQVLERIGAMADASGQTISAGGTPISHELILAAMEKIDIDFDDDGKPIMPAMVVHPKIGEAIRKLPTPTPEQNAAWEAMIERKRQAFLARRRTRRIS